MQINGKLEMKEIQKLLSDKGLETKGRVQKFIDSEVLRLCDPLVPLDSGMLKKSGITGTVVGSGKVTYNSPYARYQYYGKLMVGKAPKTLTDIDLQYHSRDSRRCKLWFERMKSQYKDDILRGAKKIAERG